MGVNCTCYLQPSVMTTAIRLKRDSTVTLMGSWKDDKCVRQLDYRGPITLWEGDTNTVGGFDYTLNFMFRSEADFWWHGGTGSLAISGLTANQYLQNNVFLARRERC
ncbi:hypothetical protein HD806DRAFT_492035 [Xylariaceae sp. AK1471]|nr:hypothetical protein HD806DRAFT_492035 [Xylariaceae sp. AK1471]